MNNVDFRCQSERSCQVEVSVNGFGLYGMMSLKDMRKE